MIKVGLMMCTFHEGWYGPNPPSFEEVVSMAADWGFEGIEPTGPAYLSPPDYDRAARKKVKELVESKGLVISNLCPYMNFSSPSLFVRKKEVIFYKDYIDLAVDLDVKILRLEVASEIRLGELGPVNYAREFQKQWEWGKECIKECAKKAEDVGVTLALDNHWFAPIEENARMIEELGSPECLKINIDIGNAAVQGEDYIDAARRFSKSVVHTHVKDFRKLVPAILTPDVVTGERCIWSVCQVQRIHWVPVGDGEVDVKGFVKVLKDIGYNGFISLEDFHGKGPWKDAAIKKSVAFLKKTLKK